MRAFREHRSGGVGPDVTRDAGQGVDPGSGMNVEAEVDGGCVQGRAVVTRANGAVPSSRGSKPSTRWCMIGFPTRASSRTS